MELSGTEMSGTKSTRPETGPAQGNEGAGTDRAHTEACSICATTLEYLEHAVDVTCSVCGRAERGHIRCPQGHYVCEVCHGAGFMAALPSALAAAGSTDPFEIAEALMARHDLPMLGCEHAHIAAGALMAALRNRGDLGVTQGHVDEALERTGRQAISAYCGLSGVCGVVPALGSCYSVLVGAQCGKGPETKATMTLVARLVAATADEAEPGCCKAYVRRTLVVTERFITERLGITFPTPTAVVCVDNDRHPHGCRGPGCDWHPDHAAGTTGDAVDLAAVELAAGAAAHPPAGPAAGDTPAAATAATARDTDSRPAEQAEENAMTTTGPGAQGHYDQFFGLAYADGALDAKTKILVSLGASLAAGCAP